MKKYFLILTILNISLLCSDGFSKEYSYDEAYQYAVDECQAKGTGALLENKIDSSSFYVCDYSGPHLEFCPPFEHSGTGIYLPRLMYDSILQICDFVWTAQQLEERLQKGAYQGKCYSKTQCNCADNPDKVKTGGTCSCGGFTTHGYGLYMDYSTCTCPPIKDINGVDRAVYDSSTKSCQVDPGYTFSDSIGRYELTSTCYYSY